ncbi:glutamate-1-semialdehyde 2,1-aminomutase [bacterium]|nr:glutamate-1-semialdehyde 2,1-aminomutase [bacterium]MBU1600062.1 glutamate-1-semialdehyde 2,1-aminomutase [bacterium]
MSSYSKSKELFAEARRYIAGGVNSPVRAFKAVGGEPIFAEKGAGSKIYDADGKEYIDYVLSFGPLILGHSHPTVISAIKEVVERGITFGLPTELETRLAKEIIKAITSIELIRFVSSGTEATMSAIRLARGFTGKDKVVKFSGGYHGHSDGLLVEAGSGLATYSVPQSSGIPKDFAKNTIVLPFNDLEAVEMVAKAEGEKIACIIVEPVAGNMGLVLPKDGFLDGLRKICTKYGIILIFDEVITGFRLIYGGAQDLLGVSPDLTCLGKVIGGGFPVGAYGGKTEIMRLLSPEGPVYQAGTLSGNPMAMAAGLTTLKVLAEDTGIYRDLEKKAKMLREGLMDNAKRSGVKIFSTQIGSLLCIFFTEVDVIDYKTAKTSDTSKYSKFFRAMLKEGIYLPPSQFETLFLSVAHTNEDIEKTLKASSCAFEAAIE